MSKAAGPLGRTDAVDRWILPLDEALDERNVGGKARNLARLRQAGLPVPDGFVIPNQALQVFLSEADLRPAIQTLCARLDVRSPAGIRCAGDTIAALVSAAQIPDDLLGELDDAFGALEGTVIVRSSAVGEDSADASFAGQLDSVADVGSLGMLRRALLQVWASQWSARALAYQLARKVALSGMGVIVQRQIASAVSGVLFTRAPANPGRMLVEYCAGSGDALVSGREDPGRLTITRDGLHRRNETRLEGQPRADLLLDDSRVRALGRAGMEIERALGCPQDIEWTLEADGRLWIVQARPITARQPMAIAERPGVHWSNANVNENFPRPITPLLYSIASPGYYHYFRNLGRAFGIASGRLRAMEQPLRHIIGVHGGRMYYNLTSIHSILRSAPFGEVLTSSFNQFVGAGETASHAAAAHAGRFRIAAQSCELAVIAVRTTWQYLFLTKRVSRFEQTVSRFAARTRPEELASRQPGELLEHLREFVDIRNNRWTDAALADAASMVCYGLLQRMLQRVHPSADQSSLHNNLLKALPDLVSGTPPIKLWELSQMVRSDARLSDLFASQPPAQVLEAVRRRDEFAHFRRQLEDFLEQWGFRCSGELMLTMPTFQEEPERVLELVQAYVQTRAESPADTLARQAQQRLEETRRLEQVLRRRRLGRWIPIFSAWRAVSILLGWTQQSIQLRERARLKQALLYSRLRRIALAIGDCLVEANRLERADDVFLLTVEEIDALLSGTSMFPGHVRPLVALRRAAHAELSAMSPPDTMTLGPGEYLERGTSGAGIGPADPSAAASATSDLSAGASAKAEARYQNELRGTGACGGTAEARAAVLDDICDAHRLAAGDVLVTRQTDPGWGPVFPLISGLVIERGGMLSHGAIIAREFGIPSVVGVRDATARIAHGARVQVDGDRGIVRIVEGA
jgi:pyruvate,water dikinase